MPAPLPPAARLRRRTLLGAALGLGLSGTCWPLADRPDDEPAVPETSPLDALAAALRPVDFDWVDTTRQRPVPVRLYWPSADALAPTSAVPLLVFSHGIGGSRVGYSYLGRHLAALGWACLHVQHVGSDRSLWLGNPFTLISRLQHAAREEEAVQRVLDLRFALDHLLDPALAHPSLGRLGERVDRERLVVAGHSYGANTTLLTAGAEVPRPERPRSLADPRYRAAIVISAPPFYGESDLAAILRPVHLPTLHVTSTEDIIEIPGYHSGVEDRIAVFEATADPRKALAVFRRGGHSVFTDRHVLGGAELNIRIKAATKTLAGAFLTQRFGQQPDALSTWERQWRPELNRTVGLGPLQSAA